MNYKKRFSTLALIPAPVEMQHTADMNIKLLAGHPLMAYTIAAALNSRIFSTVVVDTNSEYHADIARYYGAEVPIVQSEVNKELPFDNMTWVNDIINRLKAVGRQYDSYTILRPNYPFRQTATIQRAWRQFSSASGTDVLRTVEKCSQHPGKMWVVRGNRMLPLLPLNTEQLLWNDDSNETLPEVYIQNSSMEMAWPRVIDRGNLSGQSIMPLILDGQEGLDLSRSKNWKVANQLLSNEQVQLPRIFIESYAGLYLANEQDVTSH